MLSSGRFSALLGVTHTILIQHQTLTLNITDILSGRFSSFGGSGLHSINRQRHRHQMYLTMSVETSYQGGQCPCLATWSCLELSSSPVGADTHSTLLLLLPAGPPFILLGPDNQNDILWHQMLKWRRKRCFWFFYWAGHFKWRSHNEMFFSFCWSTMSFFPLTTINWCHFWHMSSLMKCQVHTLPALVGYNSL